MTIRRVDASTGEMKRLYVREAFRRDRLGRTLTKLVIASAREQRYRRLMLDTLPQMQEAMKLYRSLGFVERGPYTYSPTPGAIFFELSLS